MDSLQGIYMNNQWFRDTLQKENELLKQAVAATSLKKRKLFTQFLKLRAKRNLDYFKKKNSISIHRKIFGKNWKALA